MGFPHWRIWETGRTRLSIGGRLGPDRWAGRLTMRVILADSVRWQGGEGSIALAKDAGAAEKYRNPNQASADHEAEADLHPTF